MLPILLPDSTIVPDRSVVFSETIHPISVKLKFGNTAWLSLTYDEDRLYNNDKMNMIEEDQVGFKIDKLRGIAGFNVYKLTLTKGANFVNTTEDIISVLKYAPETELATQKIHDANRRYANVWEIRTVK